MARSNKKSEDPSIDDMLASIREAIHAETVREKDLRTTLTERENRQPQLSSPTTARSRPASSSDAPVSGTMREMRVSLRPSATQSSTGSLTTRSEDFLSYKNKLESLRKEPQFPDGKVAGIMGGDMRLEDAISQMNEATARQQASLAERARSHQPAPTAPPAADIRTSVEDYTREDFNVINAPQAPAQPAVVAQAQHVVPPQQQIAQPLAEPLSQPTPAPPPAQPLRAQPPQTQSPQAALPPPMLSDNTSQLAGASFDRLAEELFKRVDGGKTALEDGTRELLRPLLKKWLDENLPSLVERLVREEIERVARRGGR